MKFRVEIEETLSRIVEVDAETAEKAENEVLRRYRAGEIVLGGDDCTGMETRVCPDVETPFDLVKYTQ